MATKFNKRKSTRGALAAAKFDYRRASFNSEAEKNAAKRITSNAHKKFFGGALDVRPKRFKKS